MSKHYELPKELHPAFSRPDYNPAGNTAVELDYSNQLVHRLQACIIQTNSGPRDLVTGKGPAANSITTSITDKGAARGYARDYNEASDFFTTTPALDNPSNYSFVVVANYRNYADWFFSGIFNKTSNLGTSSGWGTYKNGGSGTTGDLSLEHSTSTVALLSSADVLASKVIGVTWDAVNARVYKDGLLANTVGFTASVASGAGYIKLCSNRDTHDTQATHYMTLVWDRALSDAEMRSVQLNPYQLLKPVVPLFYYIQAATGGATYKAYPLPKELHPDFSNPRRKPIGPVEVDWRNPITKNLIRYYDTVTKTDLANSQKLDTSGTVVNSVIGGYQAPYLNATNALTSSNTFSLTEPFSISFWVYIPAGDLTAFSSYKIIGNPANDQNSIYLVASGASGGTNNPFYFRLRPDASGSTKTYIDASSYFEPDTWVHFVGVVEADRTVKGYADGVDLSFGDTLDAGKTIAPATTVEIGEGFTGNDFYVRDICIWKDRALTLREAKSLYENPYQLLKPAIPLYYTAAGAAPPATTPAPVSSLMMAGCGF